MGFDDFNGKSDSRVDIFPSHKHFIDKYFSDYSVSEYYHFRNVYDRIYSADFGRYFKQNFIDKYNTKARWKIYDFLDKYLDETLKKIFFESNTWKEFFEPRKRTVNFQQTRRLAQVILRLYIFHPSNKHDYINDSRDQFYEFHKDK